MHISMNRTRVIKDERAKRFELDHPSFLYMRVPVVFLSPRNGNQVSLKGLFLLSLLLLLSWMEVVVSGTRDYRGIVS